MNPDTGKTILTSDDQLRRADFRKVKHSELILPDSVKARLPFHSALWQADNAKIPRMAPMEFVGRYLDGFFDYGIADEVHELKGETAQGNALGTMASACDRTVILTGTLLGGYSQIGRSDLLTFPVHPLQLAGIVFTIALLTLAWASRGRLNSMGFKFLHWNRTSARENAEALGFGAVCGLAVALLFQALYKSAPFKWQDAWIGITLGPLMEEAVFRGYLFGLAELGLRKRVPHPGWITGIAIAAVFALCHLPKAGITALQIGVIFVMGVVYAWLRIKSNSTTSPFLAHSAYNAIIFAAAALLA